MKEKTHLLLTVTLTAMTLATCKKKLPIETQTGAGTFECYLNGELVIPRGGGITPKSDCYYQQSVPNDSGIVFHVSGRDSKIPTI